MSAGCGEEIQVWIEKGYHIKCGDTSPTGYPWQCERCERKNTDRNWRQEAMENGENFDDEY